MVNNISILGGSGAIGSSFTLQLSFSYPNATINVFSRQQPEKMLPNVIYNIINYQDETSIEESIFAALSARVGSISDNQLGGWYSYRASKAALNMIIKNIAIEISRVNKKAIIVGLHPGTVDSNLSKPFQGNVPYGKLFTPEYSTQKLVEVLKSLTSKQSGKCFAWDGKEILP